MRRPRILGARLFAVTPAEAGVRYSLRLRCTGSSAVADDDSGKPRAVQHAFAAYSAAMRSTPVGFFEARISSE